MNNSSYIRPIFINLGSKCSDNIRILLYTTHKQIATLFFKIISLIPKDHFQSSTEVLHGWSHHSSWHFLECRDYCDFEVANIFVILNIHFAFDVCMPTEKSTEPHWTIQKPLNSPKITVWAAMGFTGIVVHFFFENNVNGELYLRIL